MNVQDSQKPSQSLHLDEKLQPQRKKFSLKKAWIPNLEGGLAGWHMCWPASVWHPMGSSNGAALVHPLS